MAKISVAVTTYNGEKYLRDQLDSILCQLFNEDEVVVSDDGSTDGTWDILLEYHRADPRVKLLKGPGNGVIANVEYALRHCSGDYIFLADQDDVWTPDKVERVMEEFDESEAMLVMHDAVVMNDDLEEVIMPSFFAYRGSGSGAIRNFIKNTYMGCCMAFRREVLKGVLPIPTNIQMHDQWIGIQCDRKYRRTVCIPDQLLYYRRHETAVSDFSHHTVPEMIKLRQILWKELTRKN